MRIRSAAAIVLLGVAAAAASAPAAEAIKPGKWEFTVEMRMPGMPALPPGTPLPPDVRMRPGADGVTVTHTACVATPDPMAALPSAHVPPPGATGANTPQCKLDRLERNGGTISWASTCHMAEATVHSEGTATYQGERMEARYSSRTTRPDAAPIEVSQHVTGRYLGPCTAK